MKKDGDYLGVLYWHPALIYTSRESMTRTSYYKGQTLNELTKLSFSERFQITV